VSFLAKTYAPMILVVGLLHIKNGKIRMASMVQTTIIDIFTSNKAAFEALNNSVCHKGDWPYSVGDYYNELFRINIINK